MTYMFKLHKRECSIIKGFSEFKKFISQNRYRVINPNYYKTSRLRER